MDASLADLFLFHKIGYTFHGLAIIQTVKLARIYHNAVVLISLLHLRRMRIKRIFRLVNHYLNRQIILPGKLKIALVMRGHGHYRTCAVFH